MVAIVWFGWLGVSAIGQSLDEKPLGERYPFLNLEENCLHFPGTQDAWENLFSKVARVRQQSGEQLHVLHIGGSHVQGGTFARRIREGLAVGLLGEEILHGPGFCFPYALAGTNSPSDLIAHAVGDWQGHRAVKQPEEGPFGLCATQARTSTPYAGFQFYVIDRALLPYPYRRVRLFYELDADGVTPVPMGWYCPDSIRVDTAGGYVEWLYAEDQDILDVMLLPSEDSSGHTFTFHGVEFWHPERSLIYHTVGANGASLNTYLKCTVLPAHATAIAPDLVVFGIGVNDANGPNGRFDPVGFEKRYEELMGHFRAANPEVAFVFITNNDTWYKKRNVNRNALTVQKVMYRLAENHGAAVWDQFEVMGGLNSIVAWQRAGLAKSDRVHFTRAGYILMGELFAGAMTEAWQAWWDRKTPTE
jgi:lysophospholipase L1-like esterase